MIKRNPETKMIHKSDALLNGKIFNGHLNDDKLMIKHQRRLEAIIRELRDTIKKLNIQEGEILNLSGENHRIMVSPYRLTLELRFPYGINDIKQ